MFFLRPDFRVSPCPALTMVTSEKWAMSRHYPTPAVLPKEVEAAGRSAALPLASAVDVKADFMCKQMSLAPSQPRSGARPQHPAEAACSPVQLSSHASGFLAIIIVSLGLASAGKPSSRQGRGRRPMTAMTGPYATLLPGEPSLRNRLQHVLKLKNKILSTEIPHSRIWTVPWPVLLRPLVGGENAH